MLYCTSQTPESVSSKTKRVPPGQGPPEQAAARCPAPTWARSCPVRRPQASGWQEGTMPKWGQQLFCPGCPGAGSVWGRVCGGGKAGQRRELDCPWPRCFSPQHPGPWLPGPWLSRGTFWEPTGAPRCRMQCQHLPALGGSGMEVLTRFLRVLGVGDTCHFCWQGDGATRRPPAPPDREEPHPHAEQCLRQPEDHHHRLLR